jgi:acetyltransferase
MTVRNLDHLFRPASLAPIGASEQPLSPGAVIARNPHAAGFAGPIMLVNPKYRQIASVVCHPAVKRVRLLL